VLDIDDGLINPVVGQGLLRRRPDLAAGALRQPDFLPEVDFVSMREATNRKLN
jgi:hypothetical protein